MNRKENRKERGNLTRNEGFHTLGDGQRENEREREREGKKRRRSREERRHVVLLDYHPRGVISLFLFSLSLFLCHTPANHTLPFCLSLFRGGVIVIIL